jgi:hypothetical protein
MCCPDVAEGEVAAAAAPEPLLEVTLTMPAAPPPITTAAIPAASNLMAFREKLNFCVSIVEALSVDAVQLRLVLNARINV